MYCLSKFCYLCLNHKLSLTNVNNLNEDSIKKIVDRIIDDCGFDLNWLKKKHCILLCRTCCLRLSDINQFLDICQKNSTILQGYISLLDQSMNANNNYEVKLCYVCLKETNNVNHSSQNSINKTFLQIVHDFAFNLNWLKTKRYILICEECCSTLGETYQFLEICHKNSTILQGYVSILDNSMKSDKKVEAKLIVNLVNENMELMKGSGETLADFCHSEIIIKEEQMWESEEKDEEQEHQMDTCEEETRESVALPQNNVNNDDGTRRIDNAKSTLIPESLNTSKMKDVNLSEAQAAERPYICEMCGKRFKTKSQVDTHIRIHTGEKPYKCNTCNKCFSEIANLTRHIKIHTGEKPFECSVCSKSFANKLNLDIHMRTHTGEKPYKCSICNRCFTQKSALNRHKTTHSDEKPYECTQCNKCFSAKVGLTKHILTHTGEKLHKCITCKKCFAEVSNLTKHMRTHDKPYKCLKCDKCFTVKINLDTHTRTHSEEKMCESEEKDEEQEHQADSSEEENRESVTLSQNVVNNKDSTSSIDNVTSTLIPEDLNISKMKDVNLSETQAAERRYKCEMCGKRFKTKSQVDTHIRIHTGEKPYKCNTCNKCFSEIANLTRHIKIHTGEKPFECSECSKSFANKLNLDLHMRTHTGEKPYKCSTCDKRFTQKSALNRHIPTHSVNKNHININ